MEADDLNIELEEAILRKFAAVIDDAVLGACTVAAPAEPTTLTLDTLYRSMAMLSVTTPRPLGLSQIVFSPHMLEDTEERLFPESRHRSARIRKKLLKRFGGEFRKKPCMWQIGGRILAHPIFRAEIERLITRRDGPARLF